jgi:hypothetical protein
MAMAVVEFTEKIDCVLDVLLALRWIAHDRVRVPKRVSQ